MRKLWFFITGLIKFLIVLSILTLIISYFFPTASVIIFILGILGSFAAAKDNVDEKYQEYLEKKEQKRILKVAEKSKDEIEGFEEALTLTRRNLS